MNFINKVFRELKPKVVKCGNRWHVLRGKHGSTRISKTFDTFDKAFRYAEIVFKARIVGRAFRYEALRLKGVKEAQ